MHSKLKLNETNLPLGVRTVIKTYSSLQNRFWWNWFYQKLRNDFCKIISILLFCNLSKYSYLHRLLKVMKEKMMSQYSIYFYVEIHFIWDFIWHKFDGLIMKGQSFFLCFLMNIFYWSIFIQFSVFSISFSGKYFKNRIINVY